MPVNSKVLTRRIQKMEEWRKPSPAINLSWIPPEPPGPGEVTVMTHEQPIGNGGHFRIFKNVKREDAPPGSRRRKPKSL